MKITHIGKESWEDPLSGMERTLTTKLSLTTKLFKKKERKKRRKPSNTH